MKQGIEKSLRQFAFHAVNLRERRLSMLWHKWAFSRYYTMTAVTQERIALSLFQQILKHAHDYSPYYRELWGKIGFDTTQVGQFGDIEGLPLVTKEIIEAHKLEMVSSKFHLKQLEKTFTGGSSGNPTSFFMDHSCRNVREGRRWGILEKCGYTYGDRCGLIWGVHNDLPSEENQTWRHKFRIFASGKQTLCCTVLEPSDMIAFHSTLEQFKPKVLYGYPNAMTQFANFILEKRLRPIKVSKIVCTAERLTEEQRATLINIFGGEVYNLYCTREHGCIGFECSRHNGFHIDTGSVHVEIIENEQQVPAGQTGDIIVTDLLNHGMPLIRNRIGDRGSLAQDRCTCGCQLPLLQELNGRITDILKRTDGASVPGIMLLDMFMDIAEIENMQIIQEDLHHARILLIPSEGFNAGVRSHVVSEFKKYMGSEIHVDIELVTDIPRNPRSGKFQEVICKMPN